MVLALPVELIEYIIHLAAPLAFSPASHSLRCYTLRQVCLASRLLRKVAQPLLHEVYIIDGVAAAVASMPVEDGGRGFGKEVKVLVLQDVEPSASILVPGVEWTPAKLCPKAVDLRIMSDDFVLRTREDILHAFLHPTSVPALRTLFLHQVKVPTAEFYELPEELPPHLLAVTQTMTLDDPHAPIFEFRELDVLGDTESLGQFKLFRLLPPPNLRLTFPEAHSFDPSSPLYTEARTASLCEDLSLLATALYDKLPPGELPIVATNSLRPFFHQAHFQQMEAALHSAPDFPRGVPLDSLHLPRTLHPLTPGLSPLIVPLRDEVVELCEREGVKLFWYDPALCEEGNRWASEGFGKWAEERMEERKRQEEGDEQAGKAV
ncbi:hypothetical protein JCM6882_000493 [Rhodosporidiobolus microsporus]